MHCCPSCPRSACRVGAGRRARPAGPAGVDRPAGHADAPARRGHLDRPGRHGGPPGRLAARLADAGLRDHRGRHRDQRRRAARLRARAAASTAAPSRPTATSWSARSGCADCSRGPVPPTTTRTASTELLGTAWDAELEPYRLGGDGAPGHTAAPGRLTRLRQVPRAGCCRGAACRRAGGRRRRLGPGPSPLVALWCRNTIFRGRFWHPTP